MSLAADTRATIVPATRPGIGRRFADPQGPDRRTRTRSNQQATAEAELLAAPGYPSATPPVSEPKGEENRIDAGR